MRSLFIMWFALVRFSFTHTFNSLSLVWPGKSPRLCVWPPHPSLPAAFPQQSLHRCSSQENGSVHFSLTWRMITLVSIFMMTLDLSVWSSFSLFLWCMFILDFLGLVVIQHFLWEYVGMRLRGKKSSLNYFSVETNTVQDLLTPGLQLWYQWSKNTLSPLSPTKMRKGRPLFLKPPPHFYASACL